MPRRFAFGRNWANFSEDLSVDQLLTAENSLVEKFGKNGLCQKTFLDVGCGSGIFSISALKLGARQVVAFDYDEFSVHATIQNCLKFRPDSYQDFEVFQGDILDENMITELQKFDIVYSWGVLHHTGDMKSAIRNASTLVADKGSFLLALYNDQGWRSTVWKYIKRLYVSSPKIVQTLLLVLCFVRLWLPTMFKDQINGHKNSTWSKYSSRRGMSPWIDLRDWVGGYPFEVASPKFVVECVENLGFKLVNTKLVMDGLGCNEYLFVKS